LTRSDPSFLLPDLPQGAEVLVARLRSLGDIVLETPAIAALHAWRPDLRICVLVEPRFQGALEGNPAVAELLFSDRFAATVARLRRRRFPILYNQHGGPRSALLTAASGSPRRVGWKGFQFSFAYNVQVPDAGEFYGRPVVHTVEHRISQFYWTGLPRGPIPKAQVFPQREAMDRVRGVLEENGIRRGVPYAVLQPGARSATMRWPAAKFAAVARWLRDARGIASVVNLSAREEEIAGEVRKEMRDCAVVPQAMDVRELIALVAGARLFVGNDSGPVHVAAATARPCVAIYGSTNPEQWRPWGTEHRVVATGATFRAIRGDKTIAVSEPRSITAIEFEEVRQACEEVLAASAAAG
jgi:ADP-heptose:LPS heptosyltransferase